MIGLKNLEQKSRFFCMVCNFLGFEEDGWEGFPRTSKRFEV